MTLSAGPFLLLTARILLASTFVRVGASKVGKVGSFQQAVAGFAVLPATLTPLTAIVVAWSELTTGALLLLGVATRIAAAAIGTLLVAFAIAVTVNLVRRRRIDCGCFGGVSRPITWGHVALNITMAAIAGVLAARPPTAVSIWPGWGAPHMTTPAVAGVIPALVVTVLALVTTIMLSTVALTTHRRLGDLHRPGSHYVEGMGQ
jgi:uncharacterized membrane protein YphA (DoxX/SURF4 family)